MQVRGKHLALPFGMLTEGGGGSGSGSGGGGGSSAPASAAGGPEGSPASPGEPGPGEPGGKRKAAGKKRAPSEDIPATLGDLAAEWIAALGSRRERKSTILFAAEVGCLPSPPPPPTTHTDAAALRMLSADRCVVGSVLVVCEAVCLSIPVSPVLALGLRGRHCWMYLWHCALVALQLCVPVSLDGLYPFSSLPTC